MRPDHSLERSAHGMLPLAPISLSAICAAPQQSAWHQTRPR